LAVQQSSRVHALPKGSCSRPERHLLSILADHARSDGSHVFPSHRKLADRAHYTLRWTRMVLHRLIARGWVIVERAGGGRLRARYRLSIPAPSFPQVMHTGDRSILSEGIDRSSQGGSIDPLREDQSIHSPVAQSGDGPAGCPVDSGLTVPVPVPVPVPDPSPKSVCNVENGGEEAARAAALEHVRLLMATVSEQRCRELAVQSGRRARRAARSA
jgi:hypothetical protein